MKLQKHQTNVFLLVQTSWTRNYSYSLSCPIWLIYHFIGWNMAFVVLDNTQKNDPWIGRPGSMGNKVSVSERRRYICKTFSNWPRPSSTLVIMFFQAAWSSWGISLLLLSYYRASSCGNTPPEKNFAVHGDVLGIVCQRMSREPL